MRKLEAREGRLDNRLEEDIPIVERILMKTNNPKVASVLALDLLLVGIDTVSYNDQSLYRSCKSYHRRGGGNPSLEAVPPY